MKKSKKLLLAQKWFKLNDLHTDILDDKRLYLVTDAGFSIQLSNKEVSYRCELYIDSEKQIEIDGEE